MVELQNQDDIEIYHWQHGLSYEINSYDSEIVTEIFEHFLEEDIEEARIASDECCVEWHITGNTLCLNHLRVYQSGQNIGRQVYNQFETHFSSQPNLQFVEIWIGTEQGTEKTRDFLIECGFEEDSIQKDYDEAYGETFRARKEV